MQPRYRFRLPRFGELTLDWSHGGGYRPALVIWRLEGRLLAVFQAGQA